MQCVILAGGLGTRMNSYTTAIPKHLIPVCGKPFAHHQLSWLHKHGVTEVVYCIGHKGTAIRDFVGDGKTWNLAVRYVDEGETLLGTAGALRGALDAGVLAPWFMVLYGDSFLPFDFAQLGAAFENQSRPAMMTVYHNENRWDAGNVQYENGVVKLYQKGAPPEVRAHMPHIDYGVSALRQNMLLEFTETGKKSDLAEVFYRLSVTGRLAGFPVHERFYEIGSPAGLQDFEQWLTQQQNH